MSISESEFKQVGQTLLKCRRPLILTHARPDGDALGSVVAMLTILRRCGAHPLPLLFDDVPDTYARLFGHEPLMRWIADLPQVGNRAGDDDSGDVDGILIVDTCSYTQIEPLADWIRDSRDHRSGPPAARGGIQAAGQLPVSRTLRLRPESPIMVVDHHLTRDELADHYLVDSSAGAAAAILFEWASACGWSLDFPAAQALFVGVATDTGWFRHSNADARIFHIAAELVRQGVQPHELHRRLYCAEPARRVRLFGAALNALQLHCDERVAVMAVTNAMLEASGATSADTENLVNEPLRIDTVELSVLLADTGDGAVKASLRSQNDVDVARLAAQFGGGGHAKPERR